MFQNSFWYMGIAFSVFLTLFITKNSFEEALKVSEEFSKSSASDQSALERNKADIEDLKRAHQSDLAFHNKKLEKLDQELKNAQEKNLQLEESVKRTNVEIQASKIEIDNAKSEAETIKKELEAKIVKEEHVLEELLEKRKEVFMLREKLQELQQIEIKPVQVSEEITAELQNLRDLLNRKDQDLFNLQFRLDSALEDMLQQEKELSKKQEEERNQKKLELEMSEQIDIFKREKDLLELTIYNLQNENAQFLVLKKEKEKLEDSLNSALNELEMVRTASLSKKEIMENTEESHLAQEKLLRRRFESMFLQLKGQFNEKAASLDEARRDLFHTQERLLKLQKDVKEYEEFSLNMDIKGLTRHIIAMQRQFDQSEKRYNQEIDHLHEIISKLIS